MRLNDALSLLPADHLVWQAWLDHAACGFSFEQRRGLAPGGPLAAVLDVEADTAIVMPHRLAAGVVNTVQRCRHGGVEPWMQQASATAALLRQAKRPVDRQVVDRQRRANVAAVVRWLDGAASADPAVISISTANQDRTCP